MEVTYMGKIAYITDSGCGHSINEMKELGIFSLPLQIAINGKNYFDIEKVTTVDVIKGLKEGSEMSTSLPSLGLIDELFKSLKANGYDRAIAVPICPGLSGTMNALYLAADQNDIQLHCLDCGVTAVVEKYLIEYLKDGIENKGRNIREALDDAEKIVASCNTLLVPNDMHHLARSGRLSKTSATIADFLLIKPILSVSKRTEGKIIVETKTRTFKKALAKTLGMMKEDIQDEAYTVIITHVDSYGDALIFADDVKTALPNCRIEIIPLYNPVAIHTGLGCIAIQYFKELGSFDFMV